MNKSGSSRLNYVLPLRTDNYIEDTLFVMPPEMEPWFGSHGGEPNDPFYPNIDFLCGDLITTDFAKDGGNLGYHAFLDLMTPTDRPKGTIKALSSQYFNELYKVCYRYNFLVALVYESLLFISLLPFLFRQFSLALINTIATTHYKKNVN